MIRYIDVNAATPAEATFASLPFGITSLTSAGNFLVAQDGSGALGNGTTSQQQRRHPGSGQRATTHQRVHVGSGHVAPVLRQFLDLYYEVIDQATGEIGAGSAYPRSAIPTCGADPRL